MLPATHQRIEINTDPQINEKIRHETDMRIAYFKDHPELIDQRLEELDREWDIERTLEANAASVSLLGTTLGFLRGRIWFLLPMVVAGFLLQHATQGWCPPLTIFRRMGVRTSREIETERMALKALRGDFRTLFDANKPGRMEIDKVMEAIQ